jgi:hypothetical protein
MTNAAGCDRPGRRSRSCCFSRRLEAAPIAKSQRKRAPKSVLKLLDLEQSKSAVVACTALAVFHESTLTLEWDCRLVVKESTGELKHLSTSGGAQRGQGRRVQVS